MEFTGVRGLFIELIVIQELDSLPWIIFQHAVLTALGQHYVQRVEEVAY